MTLAELLAKGNIRPHRTSPREVADLLRVVDRDLADAQVEQLSADRRFAIAYNAALQLATVALYAAGYRTVGARHHWTTFHVLPGIMGRHAQALGVYFDKCRLKRNVTDYDRAGEISSREVEEIVAETRAFRGDLLAWLQKKCPSLLPAGFK